MPLNLDVIKNLPLEDLMELRVAVNNRVEEVLLTAKNALQNGEEYPGFKLQPGKKSRCIKNEAKYESVVKDALAHEAYKTQVISLSTAEKLIKERYEEDELEDILQDFNATLGEKISESKLVYTGFTNND